MPADHEFTDAGRGQRLQKVMAEAGVASRRRCEELIAGGAVEVNGVGVTDLPAWVDPARDRITVNGRRLRTPERHTYVMLFKPRGVVCTSGPGQGRRRAIDLVNHPSGARLFPVGRLDAETSGLLLLTDDGGLANRLIHPRYQLPRVYELTVKGSLDAESVRKLEGGVFLSDRRRGGSRTAPARLRLVKRDRDRTRLLLWLREGRNREVRRIMVRVGHPIKKLRRVRLGPLALKGLRPGEWRDLTAGERAALKRATSYGSSARRCGSKSSSSS